MQRIRRGKKRKKTGQKMEGGWKGNREKKGKEEEVKGRKETRGCER